MTRADFQQTVTQALQSKPATVEELEALIRINLSSSGLSDEDIKRLCDDLYSYEGVSSLTR